jgi:hypothetical protein
VRPSPASSKTEGLHAYEVIPVALVAAAVSTASGIRDQETTLATEAVFLDGASNKVVAQVVRKGTGKPLENDTQAMKATDVKPVIDGWANDMHQMYLKSRPANNPSGAAAGCDLLTLIF